ncbi:MAG: hypothetical protein R2742_01890 [Micropruina glycogenica]
MARLDGWRALESLDDEVMLVTLAHPAVAPRAAELFADDYRALNLPRRACSVSAAATTWWSSCNKGVPRRRATSTCRTTPGSTFSPLPPSTAPQPPPTCSPPCRWPCWCGG